MSGGGIEARVEATRRLSATVVELTLRPAAAFAFEAGQYLRLFVPDAAPMAEDCWIPFSIGSAPEDPDLTLMIKLGPHRAAAYVEQLVPGSIVRIDGPHGRFRVSEEPVAQAIFVGGGTGLAPLRSMLRSNALRQRAPGRTILVLGASAPDELLYHDELALTLGPDYWPVVIAGGAAFQGERGVVTDALVRRAAEIDWRHAHFYLCGPRAMLDAVRELLASHGVPRSAITDEH